MPEFVDSRRAGSNWFSVLGVRKLFHSCEIVPVRPRSEIVIATTPAKAARKQWFRDYTSRYGSYSGVAAFAGDAADLIADGVARSGADRNRVRDILETSQIDGLSGPIRITPDNHSGLMPQALTLLVARSGRWRLASRSAL